MTPREFRYYKINEELGKENALLKNDKKYLIEEYNKLIDQKHEIMKEIQYLHYGLACGRIISLTSLERILNKYLDK